MSNMTAQEAVEILGDSHAYSDKHTPDQLADAVAFMFSALTASVPHVLTLPEARTLEPHTAIYAEFLNHPDVITGPYAVGTILNKGGFPAYGKTVRWWTAWPDEELRKATKWGAVE